MGVNLGIKVMSKVLTTFPYHPQVLYWACLTLGNVACDYEPNQARGQKYHIVECLVQSKITFILKLNALEDAIDKETKLMETMAATAIGEEVRNEMDLHEHRRRSLMDIYNFMQSENVLGVANYALEYMMNATQKDVQARTKQMVCPSKFKNNVLQGHILRRFINGVMEQTLYAAFRTWEMSMRELRVEQSTLAYRTKQGLILDLRKSRRQDRYRLLVNSK
ncbi:hypothetical protein DYB34_004849 [Aphanomyces astaci]|uniref:Uncharacterized protein n=1 Tax=Aphanomyces astaci TaxID=112090 RepID=A0A3R6W717_APHAT|nr:hypothetical protein DYB34_004849 [Aphanomyces astaci]